MCGMPRRVHPGHSAGSGRFKIRLIAAAILIAPSTAFAQDRPPDPPAYEDAVTVIGVTPLHGLGIPKSMVPGNVQTATAADLARRPGAPANEVLRNSFASVHTNDAQNNPFQTDVQFRGFTASPLLGLPQGLAIYQDGVRMNEPFGDTVNWDLLPTTAIASVNLMPGSNPLFGLNALGGALSIQTKTGATHPGHAVRATVGSFGRRWADFESGAQHQRWSYFVTGRLLNEDGWRDFSPTSMRQLFGNVDWRDERTVVTGSVTFGHNRLIGNGAAPIELLDEDRTAVFTHPDETRTDLASTAINVRRRVTPQISIDAVAYFRPATVDTFNGDDTPYEECEDDEPFAGFLCHEEDETPVVDPTGHPIPEELDDEELNATNNTSRTVSRGWGGSVQATLARPLGRRVNRFIAGASFDGGRSRYQSDTEIARLTEERGTVGTGLIDADAAVRLRTTVSHAGIYAADFLSVTPQLTLSGAFRYTASDITLRDQIGTALTGDHSYSRLNAAGGFTLQVGRAAVYGSYSSASRVPTPSELSCADPEDPCRLPNAFVSDPPLAQVVAGTWEGGVRGSVRDSEWTASAFHTTNRDDIIFVSSGVLTNEGHFENVGKTRRQGLELAANGPIGRRVRWTAAYTLLDAEFLTPLTLSSPNHPEAIGGEIEVPAGSSLPSTPRHNLKLGATFTVVAGMVGADLRYTSSQHFRGDEANLIEPIEGYAVVDATARYPIGRRAAIVGEVANLFGTKYSTFGLFGEPDEVLGESYEDPRFLGPGAPRAAWIGVEITFR